MNIFEEIEKRHPEENSSRKLLKKETVSFYLLDMDGCVLNSDSLEILFDNHSSREQPYRLKPDERRRCNDQLFKFISERGRYSDRIVLGSFSNRTSRSIDEGNRGNSICRGYRLYGESSFEVLQSIQEILTEDFPQKKVELAKVLLADLKNNWDFGYHWDHGAAQDKTFFDESKILNLLYWLHYIQENYPLYAVSIFIMDDSDEILKSLKAFIKKNIDFLPQDVSCTLIKYAFNETMVFMKEKQGTSASKISIGKEKLLGLTQYFNFEGLPKSRINFSFLKESKGWEYRLNLSSLESPIKDFLLAPISLSQISFDRQKNLYILKNFEKFMNALVSKTESKKEELNEADLNLSSESDGDSQQNFEDTISVSSDDNNIWKDLAPLIEFNEKEIEEQLNEDDFFEKATAVPEGVCDPTFFKSSNLCFDRKLIDFVELMLSPNEDFEFLIQNAFNSLKPERQHCFASLMLLKALELNEMKAIEILLSTEPIFPSQPEWTLKIKESVKFSELLSRAGYEDKQTFACS